MKQKLMKLKEESIIILGDFDDFPLNNEQVDLKISKNIKDFNHTRNHLHLIHIYRTCPTRAQLTLFLVHLERSLR